MAGVVRAQIVRIVRRRGTWATALTGLAMLLTGALAVMSSLSTPSPVAIAGLLAVLAGVFQVLSARLFHSVGRADPGLARSSVTRLVTLGQRAARLEEEVQEAMEMGTARQQKEMLGRVSVHLSYLQNELGVQVRDWQEFHKDALEAILLPDYVSQPVKNEEPLR